MTCLKYWWFAVGLVLLVLVLVLVQSGRWERSYGDITHGRRRLGTDGPDTISKPLLAHG